MKINFNYIILSLDHNIGGLKNTIRSIKAYGNESTYMCVVNKEISKEQFDEIKEMCEVHKAGNTVISLINKGLEKTKIDWNVFVVEGSRTCKNLEKKYSFWMQSEKDVIFPLIVDYDREGYPTKIYNEFYNCTLNGLCINKKFFKQVGKLAEMPIDISRQFWSIDATVLGANFKTILGIKVC